MSKLNVETLGQVFTQNHTVNFMLKLRKNFGSVLEPSCGAGAFSDKLPGCTAIELDKAVCPPYALREDFFRYNRKNLTKFDTIIGNPPFVKYKDIFDSTKNLIKTELLNNFDGYFDERTNLYMFFIHKCLFHLAPGGELIFINPREFLKATSSINLNKLIFQAGTITDIIDLGDARIFGDFTPNCVIWRFELGNMSRKTRYRTATIEDNKIVILSDEKRTFKNVNGQLLFLKSDQFIPFNKLFYVKVGAVSGADSIFASSKGNRSFVNSETVSTGKTKRFFYNTESEELLPHKRTLLNRKIKKFDKTTWYLWGRNNFESNDKRVYVNCKTRQQNPFFLNRCKNFDGSVLGIFPHNQSIDMESLVKDLNNVDWGELGFVCDGRFIFSQRALENCLLPKFFEKYLHE